MDGGLVACTAEAWHRAMRWCVPLAAAVVVTSGCTDSVVCPDFTPPAEARVPTDPGPVYTTASDPYAEGPLGVNTFALDPCDLGAPVPMRVHAPQVRGTYATVLFLHGWKTPPAAYDTILRHVASHGFVVVAPRLVEDCVGFVIGEPSMAEQADMAALVLDWLPGQLDAPLKVTVNSARVGLAGHSLGGKVAWLLTELEGPRVRAVAALDPVDNTAIPLGNGQPVTAGIMPFAIPSVVLGAGVTGLCSFTGANHEQYFASTLSPAWHIVAREYGHQDMLDEDDGVVARRLCGGGPDREAMRRLAGGALVALFRGELQGEPGAYRYLDDPEAMPVPIELEVR